jgi:hypothetical protein
VQRYPDAVIALAEAVRVPLPEHDQVVAGPDAHQLRDGSTVHTDGTVRLLREGKPVFFATVEMQRRFAKDKYTTLHAYHGSGVRNVNAGGHLFVLSDQASEAARFRAEDAARRAELAFAGSFHSGEDLDAMREEVPEMTMVGEALRPDMFERLRELESFREYEAKVKAEADAVAKAEAKAEAKAAVEAAVEAEVAAKAAAAAAKAQLAEGKAQLAEVKAQTETATIASNLKEFLVLRGDAPSAHALHTISACGSADILATWLKRAYLGELSAQLFPEPKPPTS